MYFSYIPYIKYDNKPITYPFSESDYVVVKNFFRRYQVNPDVFSYSVLFNKYPIKDGERFDTLAEKFYGNAYYDWLIILTNNIIDPLFGIPMSEAELRKHCEHEYEDPYSATHHYVTNEIKSGYKLAGVDVVALKGGLVVDRAFYNRPFKYWNGSQVVQISGENASRPVTIFEYEQEQNEKKREIYILKPKYLQAFVEDFRKTNLYKESTDFVTNQLKKSG